MKTHKSHFQATLLIMMVTQVLTCSSVPPNKKDLTPEPTLELTRENAVATVGNGNKDRQTVQANEGSKPVRKIKNKLQIEEEIQEQKSMYMDTLEAVKQFEISHKRQFEYTLKKRGNKATITYDKPKVKELINKAKVLSDQQQFLKARRHLKRAEHIIISAIQKMMDKQTVVYKLKLDTPLDEYIYEFKRYEGYHELIPIAIDKLRPSERTKELMDKYVKKGEFQKSAAESKAKEGDLPVAIAMLLSATKNIRQALKAAGIPQWDSLEDAANFHE